ncbi:uncharacterized protein NEMAJ01_0408 [Nematocida major]|uniref:uncharacterized protein n=1 Tax=Nematocida major TaxID=1912982 RepID=UPI002007570F|nr:uncharacterized protein NEMAJ01_0408 [Nematocida major]KAH9385512.1 hypothetical protein NEMAJ01_0408 [Nematocida major]
MESFGQQSSQMYGSDFTNMATGSIGALTQEDEMLKGGHTIDKTFLSSVHAQCDATLADDGLVHYVATAFSEVCRKIDDIHRALEAADISAPADRKENLDSVIIEESAEVGWLDRIKQIVYGKDGRAQEEDGRFASGSRGPGKEEACAPAQKPLGGASVLGSALNMVEQAGIKSLLHRRRRGEEAGALASMEQMKARKDAEIMRHKSRAEAAEAALKEANEKVEAYKSKLKVRKREISEIKSSFTSTATAEASLGKLATSVSIQMARMLLLLGMPSDIDQMHQEIAAGETGRLVECLAEIEKHIKASEQKEKGALDSMQEERAHINKQIQSFTQEIEEAKKANREMLAEAEKIREEKDALINKQRMVIKLLKSKLAQPPAPHPGVSPGQVSVCSAAAPAKEPHRPRDAAKAKERTRIEEELEARIARVQKKIKELKNPRDPLYRVHLEDLEDSRRRLNDFLQI